MSLDKNGFRGALLIKMGYYKMATPLKIQASGVVLAGRGHGRYRTILIGTGNPRARPGWTRVANRHWSESPAQPVG